MSPSGLDAVLPTTCRIVQYRLPDRYEGDPTPRWRPAVVTNPFGKLANMTVFLDGMNDLNPGDPLVGHRGIVVGALLCVGSASQGTEPGDWRWPPRA